MATRLDSITICGFRSIRELDALPLRPLNVLVGANGSGKSNFLGAFALLRALRRGRLADYTDRHGGADKILHFGSKQTDQLQVAISFNDRENGYEVALRPTSADRLRAGSEGCWFWDKTRYEAPYRQGLVATTDGEAAISEPHAGIPKWIQRHIDSWRTYHFHDVSATAPVKKTADVDDNRFLRADGGNLAAYLLLMREQHPTSYHQIRDTVRQVTPFFADFELAPLRRNPSKIKLEWRHVASEGYFDASSLSDGTLRFMCLATLFLQPVEDRPSVILIDEPELGLHPYAITLLASMMQAASHDTQVIASTQSPLLLDHFEPENVLVADLVDDATQLRRLSTDELKEWLEDYSLGELWEKNELGGRPQHG